MQIYSDPKRESEPYALPNIEVFYLTEEQAEEALVDSAYGFDCEAGWYWWACMPGYMPDGDPMGPFETKQEAIADAQEEN